MALSAEEVAGRARKIRLVLLDVDGVLTDGVVQIHSDGSESKAFGIRDGAAIVWAQREGLSIGLISGRPSEATTRRAAELGIRTVLQAGPDKRAAYVQLLASSGLTDDVVAYMGDDLLDLPILGRVGLSAAPADAIDAVRTRVHWLSQKPGGRGAVREFIELLLSARGRWEPLVDEYLA